MALKAFTSASIEYLADLEDTDSFMDYCHEEDQVFEECIGVKGIN